MWLLGRGQKVEWLRMSNLGEVVKLSLKFLVKLRTLSNLFEEEIQKLSEG